MLQKGHRKRNDYFDLLERFACRSFRGGRLYDTDHVPPKLMRQRPPFILRDEPHAIAVRSIALGGREHALII